jgi:hypothetical protein
MIDGLPPPKPGLWMPEKPAIVRPAEKRLIRPMSLMPVFSPVVGAAPAVTASFLDSATDSANQSSYSFTVTLANTTSGQIICVVGHIGSSSTQGSDISTLTIDGESGTEIFDTGTIDNSRIQIFRAPATASTSGTVSISFDSTEGACDVALYHVENLVQNTVRNSDTGTAVSGTLTVSALADGIVIAAAQTEPNNDGIGHSGGEHLPTADDASYDITYDITSDSNVDWTGITRRWNAQVQSGNFGSNQNVTAAIVLR